MKNKKLLLGMAALMLVFGMAELPAGDGHDRWWWWNYGPGSGAAANAAASAGGAISGFPVSTVAQAKGLPDHTPVAIEGKITRPLGKELFEFSDGKDTVTVEIDDHHWYAFRPEDTIIIYGEVDRHGLFSHVIEARYVAKK